MGRSRYGPGTLGLYGTYQPGESIHRARCVQCKAEGLNGPKEPHLGPPHRLMGICKLSLHIRWVFWDCEGGIGICFLCPVFATLEKDLKLLHVLAVLGSADGDFCEDPASDASRQTSLVRVLYVLGHPRASSCIVWITYPSVSCCCFPNCLPFPPASPFTGL